MLVNEIKELKARGPWTTKSDGSLMVNFAFPSAEFQEKFFSYNDAELAKLPKDIRGFRMYNVSGLKKGSIGGGEFHRVRQEFVIMIEGETWWTFEDLSAKTRNVLLTPQKAIWLPPFVLHSYGVLSETATFVVIANTLFDPQDPRTHDTYSRGDFRKLQGKLCILSV